MRLPTIEGVMRRRILVTFRVDPQVIQIILPSRFNLRAIGSARKLANPKSLTGDSIMSAHGWSLIVVTLAKAGGRQRLIQAGLGDHSEDLGGR